VLPRLYRLNGVQFGWPTRRGFDVCQRCGATSANSLPNCFRPTLFFFFVKFCNSDLIPEEFEDFMESIARKIPLKGWKEYAGGLDTTGENLNGMWSYFTEFCGNKIMFHTAPLLPRRVTPPPPWQNLSQQINILRPIFFCSRFSLSLRPALQI